jgi:hypothetical protein
VDDVIIKMEPVETFKSLRKLSIKLNLEKCTFVVPFENLLRYLVS